MSRRRCDSHDSLRMDTVRVSTEADRIRSDAGLRKTLPNPNQSNHALMSKSNLFLRSGSPSIYNIIPDFSPSAGPTLTEANIVSPTKLFASISTLVQILTTKSIRGGSRRKKYGDIFDKLLQLATNQIIDTFNCFFDYCEPRVLCIPNIKLPFNQQISDVLSIDRDATFVIQSPFRNNIHVAVNCVGQWVLISVVLQGWEQKDLYYCYSWGKYGVVLLASEFQRLHYAQCWSRFESAFRFVRLGGKVALCP